MALLDELQQYYVICSLLSNSSIFGRAKAALKPEYFDVAWQPTIKYVLEHSDQYNSVPSIDEVNMMVRPPVKIPFMPVKDLDNNLGAQQNILDIVDSFCRQRALNLAIIEGAERIAKGDTDTISGLIEEAQRVGIKKDYGINITLDELAGELDEGGSLEQWMKKTEKEIGTIGTGWKNFDNNIDGGFGWGQLIYIISPSGGGKSLALANLGLNFALQGYNVLYFTFELAQELVGKRILAMGSSIPYRALQKDFAKAKDTFQTKIHSAEQLGMFRVIDIPQKSTINDIDSRIRDIEMQFKRKFQIVILDYADLMGCRNKRIDSNNINLVGKEIAEDLRGWAKARTKAESPTLVLTASQVGKEAMSEMEFNMNDMAGSAWKINTADMIFSVRTNRTMRENGEYEIKILKNRNGGAVDKTMKIKYNQDTLLMYDTEEVESTSGNGSSLNGNSNPSVQIAALLNK